MVLEEGIASLRGQGIARKLVQEGTLSKALFKKVKPSRTKALLNTARDLEMSIGEYLFELMSGDQDSADTLSFFLED